jgi:drug/metabolite transporter (DMT)-like permease
MRRLSAILLPVVGVLYPFVVYFGMEKVAPPVFALVLAWLLLGQSIAPIQVAGALIVVGTVISLGMRKRCGRGIICYTRIAEFPMLAIRLQEAI